MTDRHTELEGFHGCVEATHREGLTTIRVPITVSVGLYTHAYNPASRHCIVFHDLTLEDRQAIASGIAPWLGPKNVEDVDMLLATFKGTVDLDDPEARRALAVHMAGNISPLRVDDLSKEETAL